ncbi:MAG: hypothetical protein GY773_04095, partial [Actinomycetia bacterium]|nr:hypothetical protein [Actinomycetes bacterium]
MTAATPFRSTGLFSGGIGRFSGPGIPAMMIAQMTPALIAATVAMTWVRPEEFMASGDIAPYLRDGLGVEVGLVW